MIRRKPGHSDDRDRRLAGLEPADWASDIVPHVGYGAAVYATLTALDH